MSLKRKKLSHILTILCFIPLSLYSSEQKIRTLSRSLSPKSIPQHLAFYELYPNSAEGKNALNHALKLLTSGQSQSYQTFEEISLPSLTVVEGILQMIQQQKPEPQPLLSEKQLSYIERIAGHLPNRWLPGFRATRVSEVTALDPEDIDIARGLFLAQIGEDSEAMFRIRSYEAMIDLMALQIHAALPVQATPEQKIFAINDFIFYKMGFRFPPHSVFAKNVDQYTFLPSVIDSRHGVCLGVSILYLSLAQRLDLPLEIITPPGHIYIRYHDGRKIINIETTARGIHVDSEEYLGIETKKLEERNIKEVIGLAFVNEAAAHSHQKNDKKALEAYEKAAPFLPEDKLLKELMGYHSLFVGDIEKGKALLQEIVGLQSEHLIRGNSVAEDYLAGVVDVDGIRAVFSPVDETRDSILEKKSLLEGVVKKYPQFREGWQSLAIAWLQLHREKEALKVLEHYRTLEQEDPTADYYLTVIYANRMDYNNAWKHLWEVERILSFHGHHPKALKTLRRQLAQIYPEP